MSEIWHFNNNNNVIINKLLLHKMIKTQDVVYFDVYWGKEMGAKCPLSPQIFVDTMRVGQVAPLPIHPLQLFHNLKQVMICLPGNPWTESGWALLIMQPSFRRQARPIGTLQHTKCVKSIFWQFWITEEDILGVFDMTLEKGVSVSNKTAR